MFVIISKGARKWDSERKIGRRGWWKKESKRENRNRKIRKTKTEKTWLNSNNDRDIVFDREKEADKDTEGERKPKRYSEF